MVKFPRRDGHGLICKVVAAPLFPIAVSLSGVLDVVLAIDLVRFTESGSSSRLPVHVIIVIVLLGTALIKGKLSLRWWKRSQSTLWDDDPDGLLSWWGHATVVALAGRSRHPHVSPLRLALAVGTLLLFAFVLVSAISGVMHGDWAGLVWLPVLLSLLISVCVV